MKTKIFYVYFSKQIKPFGPIINSRYHTWLSLEYFRRRKWQLTPVFLPAESHGQRSLAGYSLWGLKSWTQLSTQNTFGHSWTQTLLPWPCSNSMGAWDTVTLSSFAYINSCLNPNPLPPPNPPLSVELLLINSTISSSAIWKTI